MKRLFALLLALCLFTGSALAFIFEELDKDEVLDPDLMDKETISDWAQAEVYAALDAGLVPTFTGEPGYRDTITREQFAELIVQNVETDLDRDLPAASADTFTDTANPAILKAAQVDMTPNAGSLAGFTDAGQVSDWAAEGVDTLAANNIMGGTSPTTLSPKNPCTVEQSILLSWRIFALFQKL